MAVHGLHYDFDRGLQLLCVGILGLYLSKAYLDVKHSSNLYREGSGDRQG